GFEIGLLGVIDHLDRLGVASLARADFLIARIGGRAALIADRGHDHARQLPEQAFGAPEAAQAEIDGLRTFGIGALETLTIYEVLTGHAHRRAAARQGLRGARDRGGFGFEEHVASSFHSTIRSHGPRGYILDLVMLQETL